MASSAISQTTSTDVNPNISEDGDTVTLRLHIEDARLILGDLLDYEHVDSLLTVYQEKDSINMEIIKRKQLIITTQESQIGDYEIIVDNFKKIIKNKDTEISKLMDRIKDLEKEVKKLRRQKKWLIAGAVAGPVVTALIMGLTLGK
jgi:peptidoglycan hydrolase CwlO-like protein